MRVIVALEHRFERTPDGAIWSHGWLDQSFWQRYLDVFDEVAVLARVRDVLDTDGSAKRADPPGTSFIALPYYIGPWQYLRHRSELIRAVQRSIRGNEAVVLRAPGAIASIAEKVLRQARHPYGVEVVGDPLDVFSTGGVRTRLNPLLRLWVPHALRRQCRRAAAVSYVTKEILQARYPAGPNSFTTWYSTIDLDDDAYVRSPRTEERRPGPFRVLLIGSLEQLYKGPDVLIRAVRVCRDMGMPIEARIVGDGRQRPLLEQLAKSAGVPDSVQFAGRVPPGAPVRAELDAADLFVLPSRTEGLPRVLIEAMARGVPAIGSRVGGIPELLDPDELFTPGDPQAVALKVHETLADKERLALRSANNLRKAMEYHLRNLQPRRRAFYEAVKAAVGR